MEDKEEKKNRPTENDEIISKKERNTRKRELETDCMSE